MSFINMKMKIGLLGGSFNPAHIGHLHISKIALRKLNLNQVWWLVSPQNPLKKKDDMMDFGLRLDNAQAVAGNNPKIKVKTIEMEMGTRYTIDTLRRLKLKYPDYEFVWLMGADNLIQFPQWKKWREIIRLVPIHVFDRADHFYKAIGGKAYQIHKGRIHYHKIRKSLLSGTALRLTKR